jgi:hypothetical protein
MTAVASLWSCTSPLGSCFLRVEGIDVEADDPELAVDVVVAAAEEEVAIDDEEDRRDHRGAGHALEGRLGRDAQLLAVDTPAPGKSAEPAA